MQFVSWVALPAGIGLAMISSAFILTFYTNKWEETIPVMQILSLYAMVYTITYNFGDAYKAIGRPDILNMISLSTIVFAIIILLFGSRYGIVGVAWAHLLRVIVMAMVQIVIVKRVIGLPSINIFEAIFKPLLSALLMALCMWAVSWGLHGFANGLISPCAAGGRFVCLSRRFLFGQPLCNRFNVFSGGQDDGRKIR